MYQGVRLSNLSTREQLERLAAGCASAVPSKEEKQVWELAKAQVQKKRKTLIPPHKCVRISSKSAPVQLVDKDIRYVQQAPQRFIAAYLDQLELNQRGVKFNKKVVNSFLKFWRIFHARAFYKGKTKAKVPPLHRLEFELASSDWPHRYKKIPDIFLSDPEGSKKRVPVFAQPQQDRDFDRGDCYSFAVSALEELRINKGDKTQSETVQEAPKSYGANRGPGKRVSKVNKRFGEGYSF